MTRPQILTKYRGSFAISHMNDVTVPIITSKVSSFSLIFSCVSQRPNSTPKGRGRESGLFLCSLQCKMEADPFLGFRPSSTNTNFVDGSPSPSDFSFTQQDNIEAQESFHNSHQLYHDSSLPVGSFTSLLLLNPSISKKHKIHRCKTAPAMIVMRENPLEKSSNPKPSQPNSGSLLRQAALLLILYLSLGVTIYYFNRDHFSGLETHPIVDALYFCIVTMCTIGYGDIAPVTPSAKLFSCFFVLVGFGFIDIMLSGVVNYVLDLQENMILNSTKMVHAGRHTVNKGAEEKTGGGGFSPIDFIFDFAKGRMRIRLKVGLALGVVLLSIGMGTVVLYFVEDLDWVDSVYLSVLSVTTVGYGDRAFRTLPGRLFASFWLLFSTLMVARAFLYLAEARIDKRHRRIANWVLHRQITVKDLLAADINNNGFLCKSEYIVFKLKEMGKIEERDILEICNQFNKLDGSNSGKITLHRILAGRTI